MVLFLEAVHEPLTARAGRGREEETDRESIRLLISSYGRLTVSFLPFAVNRQELQDLFPRDRAKDEEDNNRAITRKREM